eukprot:3511152-Amphidinium_carterae.2
MDMSDKSTSCWTCLRHSHQGRLTMWRQTHNCPPQTMMQEVALPYASIKHWLIYEANLSLISRVVLTPSGGLQSLSCMHTSAYLASSGRSSPAFSWISINHLLSTMMLELTCKTLGPKQSASMGNLKGSGVTMTSTFKGGNNQEGQKYTHKARACCSHSQSEHFSNKLCSNLKRLHNYNVFSNSQQSTTCKKQCRSKF